MAGSDQHLVPLADHLDEVVRDEPVPPLDQVEHALALPDPAPPLEEQSNPVDIGQRPVEARLRGEAIVEERADEVIESGGVLRGRDHRDAPPVGLLDECLRRLEPFGDDDTGDIEREETVDHFPTPLGGEVLEEGDLRLAQDLNPVVGDAFDGAGESGESALPVGYMDALFAGGRVDLLAAQNEALRADESGERQPARPAAPTDSGRERPNTRRDEP